jgi:hypothetical protein
MNKDTTGEICSKHDDDEKCLQNFGPETLREENTWETQAYI